MAPLLALLLACSPARPPGPERVVWAWAAEQDLTFLSADVGVAFLARTVDARESPPRVTPRRTPVRITPGAWRAAVVRIESGGTAGALADVAPLADAVLGAVTDADALQVDWDVRTSERATYAALTRALRPRLSVPVYVTALASWCIGDRWLDALEVDGAVPMYFRLGEPTTSPPVDPRCVDRVGFSTDEPWPFSPGRRQLWVFHPGRWSPSVYATVP